METNGALYCRKIRYQEWYIMLWEMLSLDVFVTMCNL